MRKFLTAAMAIVLAFGFTGCGNNGGTSEPSTDEIVIDKNYEGSLSITYVSGDVGEYVLLSTLVDAFKQEYPNINVKLGAFTATEYLKGVSQMAAAGTIGDVFFSNDELVGLVAQKNYMQDLTDYLEAYNFDASLYDSNMMSLGKVYGKQYFLPRDYSQVVISVNKTLWDEVAANVDIEYPSNDWTLEDWYEIAEKAQPYLSANPVAGMNRYVGGPSYGWLPVMNAFVSSYGGQILNENGELALQDSDEAVFAKIKDFVDIKADPTSGDASFTYGNVLFATTTRTHYSKYSKIPTVDGSKYVDIDYLPYPKCGTEDRPYIPCGTSGYGMFSKSKHKKEAMAFLTFMMSDKGQEALIASGNAIPVANKYLDNYNEYEQLKLVHNGKELNVSAFVSNRDKVVLNDVVLRLKDYSYSTDFSAAMNSFGTDYAKNGTSWSTCIKDLRKKMEAFK